MTTREPELDDATLDDPWFDRHRPITSRPPPSLSDPELDDPWFTPAPRSWPKERNDGSARGAL